MITAITLKNFKCFKDETRIPTNQFNLLTGINGRGKSTALQPLLLFKQSIEVNEFTTKLYLSGDCVDLGIYQDIQNNRTIGSKPIIINFELPVNLEGDEDESFTLGRLRYFFKEDNNDDMVLSLNQIFLTAKEIREHQIYPKISVENEEGDKIFGSNQYIKKFLPETKPHIPGIEINIKYLLTSISFDKIHYLTADRLGPQEYHLKKSLSIFPTVGVKGENVVNILLKKGDELVNDLVYIQERKSKNTKNISKDLLTQTGEWLNEIFDGGNIQLEDTKSKIANLLLNTTGKKQDKHNKPSNIGFGFSYALPIIVSGLIAKEGEILIVENPEAHLHPRAQSRITKFLAKVSQCGVQVFIETHSDHVLNASRIAVLDKIITNEQLNILYFSDDEKNQVVTIPVKEDGGIEDWPDGFFDQTDKDYERLFGL